MKILKNEIKNFFFDENTKEFNWFGTIFLSLLVILVFLNTLALFIIKRESHIKKEKPKINKIVIETNFDCKTLELIKNDDSKYHLKIEHLQQK